MSKQSRSEDCILNEYVCTRAHAHTHTHTHPTHTHTRMFEIFKGQREETESLQYNICLIGGHQKEMGGGNNGDFKNKSWRFLRNNSGQEPSVAVVSEYDVEYILKNPHLDICKAAVHQA